jgi:arylsulfatase A-like enzyme
VRASLLCSRSNHTCPHDLHDLCADGQWQKVSPLQGSIGVSMIIAGPGVAARGVHRAPATTMDLHATFVELAGLSPTPDADRCA